MMASSLADTSAAEEAAAAEAAEKQEPPSAFDFASAHKTSASVACAYETAFASASPAESAPAAHVLPHMPPLQLHWHLSALQLHHRRRRRRQQQQQERRRQ